MWASDGDRNAGARSSFRFRRELIDPRVARVHQTEERRIGLRVERVRLAIDFELHESLPAELAHIHWRGRVTHAFHARFTRNRELQSGTCAGNSGLGKCGIDQTMRRFDGKGPTCKPTPP
jgi:hypothetical protein